ncbi:unnamed protein product [Vicia faba]|uniref:Leucine-rich repeat-containing N-terminal plant-type domain-containing protein n=1 Tax=Vicia faba TaxID=3906 RepID=A0AAV1AD49_VICFA|nr:unnamed protein product [Vicia faba]
MNPPPHFIFSALHLLFIFLTSSASQPELRSLLEFKKGITSDPSNLVLNSWNPFSITDFDVCPPKWEGISCDELTGNVTGIVLENHNLTGEIKFHTLLDLKMLKNLSLAGNQFYGGLSITLENVSSLANTVRFLNVSHNKLNGNFFLKDAIGLFWNLRALDLSDNMIRGELPSFVSFRELRVLKLTSNLFFGDVPEDLLLTSMSLEELNLNSNGFTGSIGVINSTTINILDLSSNSLSGPLPTSLRSCTIIDLSRNMFSGDISVIENWEATMEVIDLSSNKLSGSLPSIIEYSKLSTLDLSLNELNGSIPVSLVISPSLTRLNLSGNQFTGPLLLQGSGASELLLTSPFLPMEYFDVSNNSLEGFLPSDIGRMVKLKLLNLARNGFSGQIPNELSKLIDLVSLDLSNNKFTGNIPDKLSSSLNVFNVSNNDLSGLVPENLRRFPTSSFNPGNEKLKLSNDSPSYPSLPSTVQNKHHSSKGNIRIAIILASVGAAVMIALVLLAYHRTQAKEFHGRSEFGGQTTGGLSRASLFKFHSNALPPSSSASFGKSRYHFAFVVCETATLFESEL